jgi:formate hydrogenlyase transcriptional activator
MEFLKFHDWPGNIRELQNFIERAGVMSPGPRPASITKTDSVAATRTLGAAQREHILEVLDQTRWLIGGNEGAAARLAGN